MRILVILVSHEMSTEYIQNIKTLKEYMLSESENEVEYCGISSRDDFINFEGIIHFKYKVINEKRQMSKVCDFISQESELNYDWYIKIRPDFLLLEPISFKDLLDNSINARARVYRGPKRVKYGMSVNGEGIHKNVGSCDYDDIEKELILDDCIYIFHHNVIKSGAFNTIDGNSLENEYFHTIIWQSRGIPLNLIGINTICLKYDLEPGSVNM